jgi:hypothetical protein
MLGGNREDWLKEILRPAAELQAIAIKLRT